MTGDLVISGGGELAVSTDALAGAAQTLENIADQCRYATNALAAIDRGVSTTMLRQVDAPVSAVDAEAEIASALALIVDAGGVADGLAGAVRLSATAYGVADRVQQRIAQDLAARFGYVAGMLTPMAIITALPALLFAGQFALVMSAFPGGREALGSLATAFITDHRRELTDPAVVSLIRLAVMSTDDYIAGLLHLPPGAQEALGDEGLGVVGVSTSAAFIVLAASQFGALQETGVAISRVPTIGRAAGATKPPADILDRLDRIPGPEASTTGARVRIDRMTIPGKPDAFEVYIAGTSTWDVANSTNPFDMTSNMHGVAELDPGSRRAVQLAMADAGITPESKVVFSGYSQGGLIARALAASGDYATAGLVTFGGPGGQIALPNSFPSVILEHTDDFVPALGGSESSTEAIRVRREVYGDREFDNEFVVPAHERSNYRDTAMLADSAQNESVRDAIRRINEATDGATDVTTTSYVASRDAEPGG